MKNRLTLPEASFLKLVVLLNVIYDSPHLILQAGNVTLVLAYANSPSNSKSSSKSENFTLMEQEQGSFSLPHIQFHENAALLISSTALFF